MQETNRKRHNSNENRKFKRVYFVVQAGSLPYLFINGFSFWRQEAEDIKKQTEEWTGDKCQIITYKREEIQRLFA